MNFMIEGTNFGGSGTSYFKTGGPSNHLYIRKYHLVGSQSNSLKNKEGIDELMY